MDRPIQPIDMQMRICMSIEEDDYDCSVPQPYSADYVHPADREPSQDELEQDLEVPQRARRMWA